MDIIKLCFVLTSIIFLSEASTTVNINMIKEYFSHKFCAFGLIFICSSQKEKLELTKNMMTNRLRVAVFDLTDWFETPRVLPSKNNHFAVFVDATCKNIKPFLEEAGVRKLFYEDYHWLLFGKHQNIHELFEKVSLNVNADVSYVVPHINRSSNTNKKWAVYDVYNPAYKKGGSLNIANTGFYTNEYGFQPKIALRKYEHRQNMGGVVFTAAIAIPENISMDLADYLASDKDRTNNTFNRFQAVLMNNCMDFYNARVNISKTESAGYRNDKGEFDGLVLLLQEKQIDFGMSPLMYKIHRKIVIDYGHGTWILRPAFIFRHPKTTFTSYEIYVRPLVNSVWFSAMAIVILIVIFLRIALKVETAILRSVRGCFDESWGFLFLYSIGEVCQQGISIKPFFTSGRLLTLSTLLFSFLLYQFYSASIVSYLLRDPPKTITTIENLRDSSLMAGCEDVLYDKNFFLRTTNPVARDLYKTKLKGMSGFYAPAIGMKKIEKGGFAYHVQRSVAYPIIKQTFSEKTICELSEIDMYPKQFLYSTIQKGSPFIEILNYCVLHQTETGILSRIRKHWDSESPKCVKSADTIDITVGLDESYWSIVLLGCGMVASFCILGLEIIWHYHNTKPSKTKRTKPAKTKYIKPFVN